MPVQPPDQSQVPPSKIEKTNAAVRGAGVYMGFAFEFLGYLIVTGLIGYFADKWWGGGRGWILMGSIAVGMALGIFHMLRRLPAIMRSEKAAMRAARPKTTEERIRDVTTGFEDVGRRIDELAKRGKPDEQD